MTLTLSLIKTVLEILERERNEKISYNYYIIKILHKKTTTGTQV